MRRFRGIIQSKVEPQDKEILWYYKDKLLYYNNGTWEPFVTSGSSYIELELGETEGTAYEGSKGKILATKVSDIEEALKNISIDTTVKSIGNPNYDTDHISIPVEMSDGTEIPLEIYPANNITAGLMSPKDKDKLDKLNVYVTSIEIQDEYVGQDLALIVENNKERNRIKLRRVSTFHDGVMSYEDKNKLDSLNRRASGVIFNYTSEDPVIVTIDGEDINVESGKEYPFIWELKPKKLSGDVEVIINRPQFNTVTDMSNFFRGYSFNSLKLDNFDITGVQKTSNMFNMYAEQPLAINFDTSDVIDMSFMFCGLWVPSIVFDEDTFSTSKVLSMRDMFFHVSVKELNLEMFDTSNVYSMYRMFKDSANLTTLNLDFNMQSVINTVEMFDGCSKLTTVTGEIFNLNCDLDLSDCPLTADSAMIFIKGLKEKVEDKTLILKKITYDSLTPEQIKQATDKGWTIEYK